jgi:tetratricopeptide (TPR) repeat protein
VRVDSTVAKDQKTLMSEAAGIDANAARQQGFALHGEQRLIEAEAVFARGSQAHPADPGLAFGLAQTRYELGHPAAELFGRVRELAPANLDVARNQALALISEGRPDQARDLLETLLARHPDWLDGHKALATLNWTSGQRQGFADHLGPACRAQPDNPALWLAWFRYLAQAREWDAALAVLDEAERHLGATPALLVSRLFVAVESGDAERTELLLAKSAHIQGDVTSLCRIRHALRQGDAARAETEALPLLATPSAALYWPYLSLAWRMQGDDRAEWLDRPDQLIRQQETGWSAAELAELAEVLRGLHTAAQPYIEQSVRGGTQTDRSVLLRHEPVLQRIKARLLELVREYVDGLPPPDPQHPLLSAPRGEFLIEGSWSVRLARQGYNVPHTHAMGWLSTAFYVALPQPEQMGPAPAGHIAFGQPPAELGLALEPYRTIEPAPGRLAIFPSTMWHGTVPFEDGERLVIAFDIRRPRR